MARRVEAARAQQTMIALQVRPELETLIGQAHAAQALALEMADAGSPDWLAALHHFGGRPFRMSRTQTSDEATVACGPDDAVAMLEEMDAVAETIFGVGSYASAGASIVCSSEGEATYQVSMSAAGTGQ